MTTTNPLAQYGQDATNIIASQILKLPPAAWPYYLQTVLEGISPGLYNEVQQMFLLFQSKGLSPQQAITGALQIGLAGALVKSAVGAVSVSVPLPMDGWFDSVFGFVGDVASGVADVVMAPINVVTDVATGNITGALETGLTAGTLNLAKTLAGAAISTVKSVGCFAVSNPISAGAISTAAGAVGTFYGGPAGGIAAGSGAKVGTGALAGACGGGSAPPPPPPPKPVVPVATAAPAAAPPPASMFQKFRQSQYFGPVLLVAGGLLFLKVFHRS